MNISGAHILASWLAVVCAFLFFPPIFSHLSYFTYNSSTEPMASAALKPLKALVLPAITRHTATVVFIHGLGDTGHGWKPVADMFRTDPDLHHIKWILPHSPIQSVKANMDMEMPSWFDIYSFGFNTDEDEKGMLESRGLINQLITEEVNSGMDPSRIFLGGFSQGGAMSLLAGLTSERKLAALAILSSWLPLLFKFKSMMTSPASASVPIFWGHGTADPLIRPDISENSVKYLKNTLEIPLAANPGDVGLTYKTYEGMGHTTTMDELDDLKNFIKKTIPKTE